MPKHKPKLVKRPIKLQKNGTNKIIYRAIRDIHQLKNNHQLGTATINHQSQIVRNQGTYWVIV
ncbi:hypothetical protein [Nodularia spumigena]|uniref:hypothetical protein n=1 Tax=Nodularia spumigena TaxID=70799 RepID=UPI0000EAAEEA|nr:hypothetical protein [Nodularia spumigena]AHJ28584.1 ribosomal protein S7-like protein [Nodularia spumigena CCY9414]EAW43331.1 hypothetical protein N9414_06364 [Nodularia spumigena CCY9414]